jgi:hypothetical protein
MAVLLTPTIAAFSQGKEPSLQILAQFACRFRRARVKEGLQYVSFEFEVSSGDDIRVISHRDGSNYSMLNAIQLVAIAPATNSTATSLDRDNEPSDPAESEKPQGSSSEIESS